MYGALRNAVYLIRSRAELAVDIVIPFSMPRDGTCLELNIVSERPLVVTGSHNSGKRKKDPKFKWTIISLLCSTNFLEP